MPVPYIGGILWSRVRNSYKKDVKSAGGSLMVQFGTSKRTIKRLQELLGDEFEFRTHRAFTVEWKFVDGDDRTHIYETTTEQTVEELAQGIKDQASKL